VLRNGTASPSGVPEFIVFGEARVRTDSVPPASAVVAGTVAGTVHVVVEIEGAEFQSSDRRGSTELRAVVDMVNRAQSSGRRGTSELRAVIDVAH